MDFEDILFVVFMALVTIGAVGGVIDMFTDDRRFSTVGEQCKKQGYIQDENTRIYCQVEVK